MELLFMSYFVAKVARSSIIVIRTCCGRSFLSKFCCIQLEGPILHFFQFSLHQLSIVFWDSVKISFRNGQNLCFPFLLSNFIPSTNPRASIGMTLFSDTFSFLLVLKSEKINQQTICLARLNRPVEIFLHGQKFMASWRAFTH